MNKVRDVETESFWFEACLPSPADGLLLGKSPQFYRHLYLSSKMRMVAERMGNELGNDNSLFGSYE